MERQEKGRDIVDRPPRCRSEGNVNRLIEETETAIRNTRSFLEHLRSSEQNAREMVDSMKRRLEKNLRVLKERSRSNRI